MSEPVNPAVPAPNGQPAESVECGRPALNRLVDRTRHTVSGARFSVEKCPDASTGRMIKGGGVLAAVGVGAAFLAKRSTFVLIAAGIGGALLGLVSSRYHLSFDWDPDRAFGGQKGEIR